MRSAAASKIAHVATVVGLMAALCGAAPALAQAPPAEIERPAAAAPAAASRSRAHQDLRRILEIAPNRQVGQDGNDAIDRHIEDRFTEAVRANTPPQRLQQAQAAAALADRKQRDLAEARVRVMSASVDTQVEDSPAWVRFTVETPAITITVLAVVTALVLAAWYFQRRRSLLLLAAPVGLAALLLPLLAALIETPAERVSDDDQEARTTAQLEALVARTAREAADAEAAAAQALRGLWQSGRMTFPTAAFEPGEATLTGAGGGAARLYQMAPNLVEPANLPEEGFTGPLVYAGTAEPSELSGTDFNGAAVLVEFNSAKRWLDTVQAGAALLIVLEPPEGQDATFSEAAQKMTVSPLSVPRFYLRRADVAEALGEDWQEAVRERPQVTVRAEPGRWVREEVATDWLFIPGRAEPRPFGGALETDPSRQLVHIQAYKDSNSIVPELSPGATSAANLVLALELVEAFSRRPPERPVLISVVNAHANALQGEQEYAFAAFAAPAAALSELEWIERDLAQQRFVQNTYGRPITSELTERYRVEGVTVGGQNVKLNQAIVDRLTLLRNMQREERNRLQFRIEDNQRSIADAGEQLMTPQEEAAAEARIAEIDDDTDQLLALLQLFNRYGAKRRYDELEPVLQQRLAQVFADLAEEAGKNAQQLEQNRDQILQNLAVRRRLLWMTAPEAPATGGPEEIFLALHRPLPAILGLALDLSFGTDRAGLFYIGHLAASDTLAEDQARERTGRVARLALAVADETAKETGQPNRIANTVFGVPWSGQLGGKFALASVVMHQYIMPGLTLASVRDMRPHEFTPHDSLERIRPDNFDALMRFSLDYIPALVDAPELGGTWLERGASQPLSAEVSVRRQDMFSISVPKTPVPDALVLMQGTKVTLPNNAPMLGQVRPTPMLITDSRGIATLRGSMWRDGSFLSFDYDPDFRRLTGALDMGEGARRFSPQLSADLNTTFLPKTLVTSAFDKIDLLGVTQPLSLRAAPKIDIIEARQDSPPLHFASAGVPPAGASTGVTVPLALDGTASVMVEPGTAFKLRVGDGLAINSTPQRPQGIGFPSDEGRLRNLVLIGAIDKWRLTEERLDLLETKGVSNETATEFNESAETQIQAAVADAEADRNAQAMRGAERGRGLAYQAYLRGLSTINDLIKAVVIFLALVIPFCFFVTKLVTPWTDVNRQLALFAAIFVAMALTLRFVHPAFEVARTPEVVILAFIILGLAGFVSMVIASRFNASMTQAVEESQLAESVEAPQGRLAGVAFLVGVNNMKRRRIRTTLTTATIVLVTFTMLSVISVGQDVEPATVRLGATTPYTGILYANPGLAPIDALQVRRLRQHFADKATVVTRAWAQRLGTYGEYLPYQLRLTEPVRDAAAQALDTKVLVGVERAEHGFLGPMPIVAGRWISSDSAAEVLLSESAARLLGVTPENFRGRRLLISGREVELVGLLDDVRLAQMRDLSDQTLLPQLTPPSQTPMFQIVGPTSQAAEGTGSLEAGGSLTQPGMEPARPIDVAFVPIELARSLGEAEYRTMSVKYTPREGEEPVAAARRAWDDANDLIRFHFARITTGLETPIPRNENDAGSRAVEAGQYTLASSSSTEVGGILKVAIPIILAATIILNTMLGSVMERRREVAIYNAIGLNPGHVMMFFLAESFVFGLVGSVAGYLIGQGLSILITHTRIIDLNLNYSSLSVMVVIFLTIATVLLSTVYPAMMAARAAVPSGQRRWSLPQPEGDQIHVQFPFSYDASRVLGVCAYLRDYMRQNSEASTGKFLARLGPVGRVPAADGVASGDGAGASASGINGDDHRAYAMLFDVAPAPFDLGVNQKMEVYAYYDARVRAHMLAVHLTRVSGEMSNWVTVNQPFLEALRKRLLGWRSQKPETHEAYFHEGEQLFADAPDLPVDGSPSREDLPQRVPAAPATQG